jgi:hypothetical protein
MYVVIKTIKGRRYRYLQASFREGKRVRTRSICLGRVDGAVARGPSQGETGGSSSFLDAQRLSREDRMMASAERAAAKIDEYQREAFGETAAERTERVRQEHLSNLHSAYGLRTSDKMSPEPAQVAIGQSSAVDAKGSPSNDEGQEHGTTEEHGAQNN